MKIITPIVLALMVLLAFASGVTKIMLMPQEIEFYRPAGFSDTLLMLFGALQVLSGVALVFRQSRGYGALLLALTFLISAVLLIQAGNWPLTMVTLVCVLLLAFLAKTSGAKSGQII